MEPERKYSAAEQAAWQEQERFVLESGRQMSLRSRLLWLEEMHDLVLRWSLKRPMMYPDGTLISPDPSSVTEAPGKFLDPRPPGG